MNISEHTQVLKAYIDRLTVADIDLIASAVRRTWNEQLNGNAGSQAGADDGLRSAIENALSNLSTGDRFNIAAITYRNLRTTVNRN